MTRWTEADLSAVMARRGQPPVTIKRNKPKPGLIVIPGEPVPKPRQTQRDKWLDPPRPCVARYRAWADNARLAYGVIEPQRIGATRIMFIAYFQMPKSWPQKKKLKMMGQPHLDTPDCSNILKAIEDSLFTNDQAVYAVEGKKYWTSGESRIELVVL